MRAAREALASGSGKPMRKDGLPQKPSWTPNRETAAIAPFSSAILSACDQSPGLRASSPFARAAGKAKTAPKARALNFRR